MQEISNLIEDPAILSAANNGDIDAVKKLLAKKISVNSRNHLGLTALHLAVRNYDMPMVRFLVENNADVNAKSNSGFRPLDFAEHIRRADAIQYLVKHGAQILKESEKETIRQTTKAAHKQEVAQQLKEQMKKSFRPELHKELEASMDNIIKKIIEEDMQEQLTQKAQQIAEEKINEAIRKKIQEYISLAIPHRNTEAIEFFLAEGIDINLLNKNGGSAFHLAVAYGSAEFITWLLENYDVDINSETSQGLTAIDIALAKKRLDLFLLLWIKSAEITTLNVDMFLHIAVETNNLGYVQCIMPLRPDVNSTLTDDEWTPLHVAANGNCLEIGKYLVENKANTRLKNAAGLTAFELALRKGCFDVAQMLIEKTGSFTLEEQRQFLHYATEHHNIQALAFVKKLTDSSDTTTNSENRVLESPRVYIPPDSPILFDRRLLDSSSEEFNVADEKSDGVMPKDNKQRAKRCSLQ